MRKKGQRNMRNTQPTRPDPMEKTLWSDTRFVCHFVTPPLPSNTSRLPFTIGGATQQGPDHIPDNLNNQDALGILVEENFMMGVISDGCTDSASIPKRRTNNEVGAKLINYLVVQTTKKLLKNYPDLDGHRFVEELSREVTKALMAFVHLFSEEEESTKELFIADFLMTTLLGMVVCQDRYIVFGRGDGVVGINGEINLLEKYAGSYLGEDLVKSPELSLAGGQHSSIKLLAEGLTTDLNSLFLATDGFYGILKDYQGLMDNFIKKYIQKKPGLDTDILREFRLKVIWSDHVKQNISTHTWFKDDATFVLLRRIEPLSRETEE
ncbi:MAG: hypothetical protein BWK78_03565 [Thiotrichaceae bacterium IS1]|nr:MAG: hypothetical protein BWK78_03565 [Thiotrichaceae bacterium IS1]